jgi:sterol desaturase/sphingolipid hydroxylase (fatty acid hydroxylase superfamily)
MIAYLRWPLAYGVTLGTLALLLQHGVADVVALGLVSAGLWSVLALAERRAPRIASWRRPDGQAGKDVLHGLFGFGVGSALGSIGAGAAFAPVGARVALWPSAWPLALQVALGLLLFEVGSYAQHRWIHRTRWAFPFHAVHHNPRRLVLLKTTRNHAFDLATATFVASAPVVALGASPRLVLWIAAVNNVSALVQHANVELPTPRWLDLIVSTPRNHRVHHARDLSDSNSNYGMNLMLFDRLFGTFARHELDLAEDACGMSDDDGTRSFAAETFQPNASSSKSP